LTKLKIIISGGGTGGHIYPAIAIANFLKTEYPETDILFVGAEGRMEMEKIPQAGYEIAGLPIQGIQRRLTVKNLQIPFKLFKSLRLARRLLGEFKPHVCVGMGGYASGPLLYAASLAGTPTLIQEQNSFAGLTNRWLAAKAHTICVAYPGMEKFFPAEKIVLTGNPVRREIVMSYRKREEARQFFNLTPGYRTLLVLGGSLGAKTLNDSLLAGKNKLKGGSYEVIWQTGKNYFAKIKPETTSDTHIHLFDFIQRMDLAYAAADVVISRAGALSVSEICVAAKPAILVPSPNVAEDHQTRNAMALVNENAALLISDADARQKLVDTALSLLADTKRCNTLAENVEKFALPDAASRIVKEILNCV
jgi:UDP-N-acetylglucosamine--N-acetylmuramyl-(pentapeptide) pyrophosphoryl-undecaprenol N-acetylglucosamine transferase